jgi:predicted molibdopterin-dependent oxidoreductase YjgC
MRITEHPILGEMQKKREVPFRFDGKELFGREGEPIAAALRANGVLIHRYTKKRKSPRGVFCAIGRCTDCVMVVDGRSNVRTCVTPLLAGMSVETQHGASAAPAEARR